MSSCGDDPLIRQTSLGQTLDTRFPDPFCDAASTVMPTDHRMMLRWSEYLVNNNGVYREAIRRVISYFITDINIEEKDDKEVGREEKKKYETFLNDTLGIKNVLHAVALDYMTYGNSFTSLLMPFRRYLACKQCHLELPLRKVYNTPEFQFRWTNFEFHAHCPHCKYTGPWRHVDRRSGEQSEIKVKRWNPHEIDLVYDTFSDSCTYIWRVPDDYRQQVRQGYLHILENASWEVIQAVKANKNLMFDKDVIYHMREYTLAGMRNRGWGMSRVLSNFRIAWYLQILWRYNEAFALDYIIPFRVLTPAAKAGSGPESQDPVHTLNLSSFSAHVNKMLALHRKDPARWNVLPYSLEYQALGGEATQLAPKDLIDQALDTLLTAIGVPVEFYKGSLSVQAAPAALRLFEANWSHLTHNLNVFVSKLVSQVGKMLGWEPVSAKLIRVTHADDLNRQMAKLQMMTNGIISKGTGLDSIGVDNEVETRKMLQEQRFESEEQQRMQDEMEQEAQTDELMKMLAPTPTEQMTQQAQGGAPAPGQGGGDSAAAAPAPQMTAVDQFIMQRQNQPNTPITPDEMEAQAQGIAQQLLVMPDAQRKGELAKLRKSNSTVHHLVTSILDSQRDQLASQGQQVMLAQMGKQAGIAKGLTRWVVAA